MAIERANILGVGISAVNMGIALDEIDRWIVRQEAHYVCVTPVHSVMECHRDPILRSIFNKSGLTTPDGMPIVWLCRQKGYRNVGRVYGPDLMLALCERSLAKGYSHFMYGGTEKTLEQLAKNLSDRFPGLSICGSYAPPFRALTPEENQDIVTTINAARPDIVWVGLGAPKQERWMAAHIDWLNAPVLIGVGAAFDFHAEVKRQAPLWMQRNGLEWFFRLLTEPRRLWKRYLIDNSLFVLLFLAQTIGLRHYALTDNLLE